MAEFKKYLMKNQNDYRPDVNDHEVALIKSSNQGDWAYGSFSIIDEDMIDLTEEEKYVNSTNGVYVYGKSASGADVHSVTVLEA